MTDYGNCSHCLRDLRWADYIAYECRRCHETSRNMQYMDIPTIVNILQKVGKFEQVKNYGKDNSISGM